MSGFLQPYYVSVITSPFATSIRRKLLAYRARSVASKPNVLVFYMEVDSPYTVIGAQLLRKLLDRYGDLSISVRVLPTVTSSDAVPHLELFKKYSWRDAVSCSKKLDVEFSLPAGAEVSDSGAVDGLNTPSEERIAHAQRYIIGKYSNTLIDQSTCSSFISDVMSAFQYLFDPSFDLASDEAGAIEDEGSDALAHSLAGSMKELHRLGHYLGGMVLYQGEWYSAVDRLHHLEQRLVQERTGSNAVPIFPVPAISLGDVPDSNGASCVLDIFYSFRSPYCYLSLQRLAALKQHYGSALQLRFLLIKPMVQRNVVLSRSKKMYILYDASREAKMHGVPFDFVRDPLPSVDLALCVGYRLMNDDTVSADERDRRVFAFLRSFGYSCWARGEYFGTEQRMKTLLGRLGLDAELAANAEQVKSDVEDMTAANQEILREQLGLWGVPSFRVRSRDGDQMSTKCIVWGQDRLSLVSDVISSVLYSPVD